MGGESAWRGKILFTVVSGQRARGQPSFAILLLRCSGAISNRHAIARRFFPECAATAWPRQLWKTQSGMPRRNRRTNPYVSYWAAHDRKSLAAYRSEFRTLSNNYWIRFRLNWELATGALK